MTWHKKGKRYNVGKMVHPSDGEAWTRFNDKHHEKADEARNVRVALTTDEFNPYGLMSSPYTCWPMFVTPSIFPRRLLSTTERILAVDYFWTPGE